MPNNLLEVKNLTKEFRIGGMLSRKKMRAVDGVSFSLPADKPVILSVVGESGCGKTTLTKMILRLLTPTSGSISINGQDCLKRSEIPNSKFRTMVQPIFQNPFDAFSSRRQVIRYLMDTAASYGGAKNREAAVEAVSKALKSVGMSYEVVAGKYATQFSGGELQRISIARALITSPRIIIADEPVAMIDASLKINIVNLFKQLKDEFGISFIYITHDLSTAYDEVGIDHSVVLFVDDRHQQSLNGLYIFGMDHRRQLRTEIVEDILSKQLVLVGRNVRDVRERNVDKGAVFIGDQVAVDVRLMDGRAPDDVQRVPLSGPEDDDVAGNCVMVYALHDDVQFASLKADEFIVKDHARGQIPAGVQPAVPRQADIGTQRPVPLFKIVRFLAGGGAAFYSSHSRSFRFRSPLFNAPQTLGCMNV